MALELVGDLGLGLGIGRLGMARRSMDSLRDRRIPVYIVIFFIPRLQNICRLVKLRI